MRRDDEWTPIGILLRSAMTMMVLGAVALGLASPADPTLIGPRPVFAAMLRMAVLVLVVQLPVVVVHEIGHALLATALAARPYLMRVGPVVVAWDGRWPRRLLVVAGWRSYVRFEWPTGRWARRRWVAVVAAGPLANVLAGGVCLGWGLDAHALASRLAHGQVVAAGVQVFGLVSLVTGVSNLVPVRRAGGGPSDGYQIWVAVRSAIQRQPVARALGALADGVSGRDLAGRYTPRLDRPEPAVLRIRHALDLHAAGDTRGVIAAVRAPCRSVSAGQRRALDGLFVAAATEVSDPELDDELDEISRRLLELDPDQADCLHARAAVLMRLGRAGEAVSLLQATVDRLTDERRGTCQLMLAQAIVAADDPALFEQADELSARAVREAPDDVGRLWIRAGVLSAIGQPRRAADLLAPLTIMDDEDGAAASSPLAAATANAFAMAVLYAADTARYSQADAASAAALRLAPHEPAYLHTRGWLLIETGRVEDGLDLVRASDSPRVRRQSPSVAAELSATSALGHALLGEVDTARALLAEAEALDPRCRVLPRIRQVLGATAPAPGSAPTTTREDR